jgi:hypothetical protein
MNELQLQFLKEKGLANDESVVDCDPDQQTVTFADGMTRTTTEIWSRAMGYFRPISFYNPGKQQEHRDRKFFTESKTDRIPAGVLVVDHGKPCHRPSAVGGFSKFEGLAA